MQQQQLVLNAQTIEQIRQQTKQTWRKCQRRAYNIYACLMPAGLIYANKLEQPESFNAINKMFHKNIITEDEAAKSPELVNFLKQHGFYMTDGSKVTLCGTKGELWDVKPEKFVQSYRLATGEAIREIPKSKWFVVSRAPETKPSAVGIQLPKAYLGVYQTSWATLMVNNQNSSGHGKGDILVAPLLPNGQPDYNNISPTNNEVFSLTYNLVVGGWSSSDLLTNVNSIKTYTIDMVNSEYRLPTNNDRIPSDFRDYCSRQIINGARYLDLISSLKDFKFYHRYILEPVVAINNAIVEINKMAKSPIIIKGKFDLDRACRAIKDLQEHRGNKEAMTDPYSYIYSFDVYFTVAPLVVDGLEDSERMASCNFYINPDINSELNGNDVAYTFSGWVHTPTMLDDCLSSNWHSINDMVYLLLSLICSIGQPEFEDFKTMDGIRGNNFVAILKDKRAALYMYKALLKHWSKGYLRKDFVYDSFGVSEGEVRDQKMAGGDIEELILMQLMIAVRNGETPQFEAFKKYTLDNPDVDLGSEKSFYSRLVNSYLK
jgi:hypothetical protein